MRPRFSPPGLLQTKLLQQGLVLILCLFCKVSSVLATISDDEVNAIVRQAEELQLAQHETWLALLHYKRETLSRRFISQADDEGFFLDKKGKTDARAELKANIIAFLKGPYKGHAQCRFPARWWWLKQQIDLQGKHEVRCPLQEAYMTRISQNKLFLVFPTMYLNNPGSTFGHTFLRFDGEEESILLSQTLNYAARADKTDGLLNYVRKGLFGGYKGFFKLRPYYETVQEYSNIENRDIWEYQLAFSEAEIAQLARHIWEVKGIDFDYYFFRENCAYRLLALLDVVRSGMQLTGENNFPVYAIPVDTVRALDDKNMIVSREFRASLATQINESFSAGSDDISTLVIDIVSEDTLAETKIISNKLQGLSTDSKKLQTLRRSFDVLQFYGLSTGTKAQTILQLMSSFPASKVSDEVAGNESDRTSSEMSAAKSPEQGHESLRVTAGYGKQNNNQYIDLRFRSAFHDLLDAPQGYIDGASINAFDFRFKWFVNDSRNGLTGESSNNLRLESLSFINVTSINPVKRWITPISWMFDIRLDRTQFSKTQSVRNFIARGGAGLSFKQQSLTPFALVMAEWNLSSSYDKGYSLLLGIQAGFYFNIWANQFMLSYEKDSAIAGFELDRNITQVQWQYNLQVNHALRLSYKRIEYDFFDDEDWSIGYHYYF